MPLRLFLCAVTAVSFVLAGPTYEYVISYLDVGQAEPAGLVFAAVPAVIE